MTGLDGGSAPGLLVIAWLIVVCRAMLLRGPQAWPITLFLMWWAVASTVAYQPVTDALSGTFGHVVPTVAFWATLALCDVSVSSLAYSMTADLDVRIARRRLLPAKTVVVGAVLALSPFAPPIDGPIVFDWQTTLFVSVASIPLGYVALRVSYVVGTRWRSAYRRSDRVFLIALWALTGFAALQLVGFLVLVASAGAFGSGVDLATTAVRYQTSGLGPTLNLIAASIVVGLPGFRRLVVDSATTRRVDELLPLWTDMVTAVPEVTLTDGTESTHERLVWMDADVRDALAVLEPFRAEIAPSIAAKLDRRFSTDDDREAARWAVELLAAERSRGSGEPTGDRPSRSDIDVARLARVWRAAKSVEWSTVVSNQ